MAKNNRGPAFLLPATGGFAVLMFALWFNQVYVAKHRFSSLAWCEKKSSTDGVPTRRIEMVEDLVRHHLRSGMRRSDVRSLLGAPGFEYNGSTTYPGFKYNGPTKYMDLYALGPSNGFDIDPKVLFVAYDKSGIVYSINVR